MDIEQLKDLSEIRLALNSGCARAVREAAGLSQSEIAKAVGVTQAAIALWESGRRVPRGDAALRYAAVIKAIERVSS